MTRATIWLAFVFLAICTRTSYAADTAALAKRLQNTAGKSSIDDLLLKPWHLKLTVQLFDTKGNPTEQGSIEEWWSAGNYKRLYASQSYNAIEIKRGKDLYRTAGQTTAPYMLDLLRSEVVHPLANEAEINDSVPDPRVESFDKIKLDCIMLDHPIKNVPSPPLGLFPTYCLDQGKDRLRISFRYGSEQVTRNAIGSFQERDVARDTAVSLDGIIAAKAHIDTLAGIVIPDHFFDPDSNLQLQNGETQKVGAGGMDGKKILGVVPIYPATDRTNHTSGSVHMRAVIGTDGRIHELTVIDTPSPTLALSALSAVRQWVYKPFMLNGLPCSVETTITVNYNFAPR